MKKNVGFIGYRGMVGSVLLQRLLSENNFSLMNPHFFSSSKPHEKVEIKDVGEVLLKDAHDIDELSKMDILVTTQGTAYSLEILPRLRNKGFKGYWIDAASSFRLHEDSALILDPVNRNVVKAAKEKGIKNLIGPNCTVSLMLMALQGLYEQDLIEWVSTMTYQAASGAGAPNMKELLSQMKMLTDNIDLENPSSSILDIDTHVQKNLSLVPQKNFGAPLALSLIPWIDSPMDSGQTKEEWKGQVEATKILGKNHPVVIDGICVRVGSMRSHAQALTIKMKKNIPLKEIEDIIRKGNPFVELIENSKEETLKKLTPAYVSGTLKIAIGRLHKLSMGEEYLGAFTVGDQLLWGAAEPLRVELTQLL